MRSINVRYFLTLLTYSLDAGTELLSPMSHALQRGILLRQENPTYM